MTAPVWSIAAVCATTSFKVGGSVSGLASGKQVMLQNNGADPLLVNANGAFSFATPVPCNGNCLVTVSAQPPGQTCTVNGHAGSAVVADIATVAVVCTANAYSVGGSVTGLSAGKQVTLANNGGDHLTLNSNGAFSFATPLADGARTPSPSARSRPARAASSPTERAPRQPVPATSRCNVRRCRSARFTLRQRQAHGWTTTAFCRTAN